VAVVGCRLREPLVLGDANGGGSRSDPPSGRLDAVAVDQRQHVARASGVAVRVCAATLSCLPRLLKTNAGGRLAPQSSPPSPRLFSPREKDRDRYLLRRDAS